MVAWVVLRRRSGVGVSGEQGARLRVEAGFTARHKREEAAGGRFGSRRGPNAGGGPVAQKFLLTRAVRSSKQSAMVRKR